MLSTLDRDLGSVVWSGTLGAFPILTQVNMLDSRAVSRMDIVGAVMWSLLNPL